MLKAQTELAITFQELGSAMESLGSMETQIQGPVLKFAEMMPTYVTLIKEKVLEKYLIDRYQLKTWITQHPYTSMLIIVRLPKKL